MNLYEHIINSNEDTRKNYAISVLKYLSHKDSAEEKIAFATLEMAILDIGKEPKYDSKGDISEILDSRMEWCNNPSQLKFWADVVGVEWGFIVKVFKKFNLLDGINPKTGEKWEISM